MTQPGPTTNPTGALTEQFLTHLRMIAGQHTQRRSEIEGRQSVWDSCEALVLGMAGDPVVIDSLVLPDGMAAGEVKQCFYNAFVATLDHPNLVFVEGYAMPEGMFPVNHAWCIDRETKEIVDPTWASLRSQKPVAYLGLPFSRAFVQKLLEEDSRAPSVFENDWRYQGRTAKRGLVLDKDGFVADWGDPPPF